MEYKAYIDDTLLLVTDNKRAAFRAMRDAERPNARYYMETDGQREEYYITHRSDGRVSFAKRDNSRHSFSDAVKAGKIKQITATFYPDEYAAVKAAADQDGIAVSAWAKKTMLEAANLK